MAPPGGHRHWDGSLFHCPVSMRDVPLCAGWLKPFVSGTLWRMTPNNARRLSFAVWLVSVAAWVGYLAVESNFGFANCELVATTSVYGEPAWSWLSPGTTCVYDAVTLGGEIGPHVDAPPLDRLGIALVLLVLWPLTLHWATQTRTPSRTG